MPTPSEQLPGTTPADPVRTRLVEAARTAWVSRLIDVSRRNNLLFYRPTPTSSIDVPETHPTLPALLAGKSVSLEALLAESDKRPGRVLSIARKAQENSEEKGLQTLYLALGFASWQADDGGRDARAPVFLLPVQTRRKGKDVSAVEVQVAGEPKVNPVLLHVLRDQFNLGMNEDELMAAALPVETEPGAKEAADLPLLDGYRAALAALEVKAHRLPGLKTELSGAISNFSFAKLALVNDLETAGEKLHLNEVVAAIAGDSKARGRLGSSQVAIDPKSLDSRPPEEEFCVVEADSSQQCAIAGIVVGQNAVIHGPPGTGKSQTITNLIASLVANGKKVLFVAEKRAALEVVQQRLQNCGLDHLAMDLHGAELSPKKVMERVTRTLNLVRDSKPVEAEAVHRQFGDRRSKLNAHDAQMHTVSERAGKTVCDLQGALLRLPGESKTSVRWRGLELAGITSRKAEQVRDLLREAVPFASLFLREDASAWTGVAFRNGQEVQNGVDLAQRLAHESLPCLSTQIFDLTRAVRFCPAADFGQADSQVALLKEVQVLLDRYDREVFAADLPGLLRDLGKAKDGGLKGSGCP